MDFLPTEEAELEPAIWQGVEPSLLAGASILQEENLLGSLWSNLRDVFFPLKLPPLVLESKPILLVDRMAMQQDPKATVSAIIAYTLLICLLLWGASRVHPMQKRTQMEVTDVVVPPPMPVVKNQMSGGGGQHKNAPVSQGKLPEFAKQQITPPKAPPMEQPKIHMPDPTLEVQTNLKMANSDAPNFGMPNSPLAGNSMGTGRGGGIGSGNGNGHGPGFGGNTGGGVMQIGGAVSQPIPIYQPTAEYSDEARRAKFQGIVTVSVVIDAQGHPQNVHLARGVGMGLDEKAIEAVRQYRFKPAKLNGKPVAVYLNVQISFDLLS